MAKFDGGETDAFLFGGAFAPGASEDAGDVFGVGAANTAYPRVAKGPHDDVAGLARGNAMLVEPHGRTPVSPHAAKAPEDDLGETAVFMAMAASRVSVKDEGRQDLKSSPVADEVPGAKSDATSGRSMDSRRDCAVRRPAPSTASSCAVDPGETAVFMAMAASRDYQRKKADGVAAGAEPAAAHGARPAAAGRAADNLETVRQDGPVIPHGAARVPHAKRPAAGPASDLGETAVFMAMAASRDAAKTRGAKKSSEPGSASNGMIPPVSSGGLDGAGHRASAQSGAPRALVTTRPALPSIPTVPSASSPSVSASAPDFSAETTGRLASVDASSELPAPAAAPIDHGAAVAPVSPVAATGPHTAARPAASVRPVSSAYKQVAKRGVDSDGKPPRKPGRVRNAISIALIVVGVVLLLVAGGLFIHAQLGYKEAQESYAALAKYAKIEDKDGVELPQVDWDGLASVNSDVVGWIYVPGTEISYPVVQGKDNSTYLNKLFDGTRNASGAIFMDMDDTAPGVVDQQTTLYGHHMNDGSMFNVIDQATDQSVFDTIQAVYYLTPDATYTFKPLLTAKVEDTYLNARATNFTGDTTLAGYLADIKGKATATASDVDERIEQDGNKLLTLVTCATAFAPTTTRAVMVCTLAE